MWGRSIFGAQTAPIDSEPAEGRAEGGMGEEEPDRPSGGTGRGAGQAEDLEEGKSAGGRLDGQEQQAGSQGEGGAQRLEAPRGDEAVQEPVIRTLGLPKQESGRPYEFRTQLPPVYGSIDGWEDITQELPSQEQDAPPEGASSLQIRPVLHHQPEQGGIPPGQAGRPAVRRLSEGRFGKSSSAEAQLTNTAGGGSRWWGGYKRQASLTGKGQLGGSLEMGTPLDDTSFSSQARMGTVQETRPMSSEGLAVSEQASTAPSTARSALTDGKAEKNGWLALLRDKPRSKSSLSRRRLAAHGIGVERRGGPKVKATKAKVATAETSKGDEAVNESALVEERIKYIEETYVKSSTLKEPGELGRLFQKACTDMGDTWKITVANPIAAALASPKYNVLFGVLSIAFLTWMASSGWEVRQHGRVVGREWRFNATELRGGMAGDEILDSNIADAGVLVEGCVTRMFGTIYVREGHALRVVFPEDIEVTGWWFATSLLGDVDFDPIRFTWEVKEKGGWRVVGASAWRFNHVNGQYFRKGTWPTSRERGAMEQFDQRAPWHWAVSKVAPMFVNSVMFGLLILCAFRRFLYAGKYVIGLCLLFETFIYFTSAVADTSVQGNWFSFWWWLVIASFLSGNAVIFMRRFFMQLLLITGIGCLTVGIVEYAWYMWDLEGFLYAVVAGIVFLGIAVMLISLRLSAVNSAYLVISDDRALYEQVWEKLCDDPNFKGSLAELRKQCERALVQRSAQNHGDKNAPKIRQNNRLQHFAVWSTDLIIGTIGMVMRATPVLRIIQGGRLENLMAARQTNVRTGKRGTLLPFSGSDTYYVKCIDQLYAQASEAEVLLRRKIRKWAFVSQGMLMMQQEDFSQNAEWVLWAQAKADKVLENRIMWTKNKKPERAVDKCLKRYDRKIYQLVDICRESLYFQTVADMTQCLKAMSEDIDIVIDRVKNRMVTEDDASLTCGFRKVTVNLRIRTWEAEQRGVESHVCEVRLILIDFAELMTEERHKRYVEYRDKIGA